MPRIKYRNWILDARPDRIDLRDRTYMPSLVSLPPRFPSDEQFEEYLPEYTSRRLILHQGTEGACTGFGLAAVINYLNWRTIMKSDKRMTKVSERMLYNMARIYDEWEGEDYDGSSCRGAMKGWHKHGVCAQRYWPYAAGKRGKAIKPREGWQQDASRRPLGAYYRINKDSIADMQSAIHEVGALYVSADVHEGWYEVEEKNDKLAVIPFRPETIGGHAFALVGYEPRGFVMQNSWGSSWGFGGFAILSYEDWVENGFDAWVAVLGAPMSKKASTGRTFSSTSLVDAAGGSGDWRRGADRARANFAYKNKKVAPWSEERAYEHNLVLGNNGRPLNRFLDCENSRAALKEVAYTLPRAWFKGKTRPKLAIYVHGGLNNEAASVRRIRVMAPYFLENGIYPLFITWRTGAKESLAGIVEDAWRSRDEGKKIGPVQGWLTDMARAARDYTIEQICERLLVKATWMQMKQNAAAALGEDFKSRKVAESEEGLLLLAEHLKTLKKRLPRLEIHLMGHSAGSILLGYLLDKLGADKVDVKTVSLYAPACSIRFANEHYIGATRKRILSPGDLYVDLMDDEHERADSVGPYGKSLLYLVSRALEDKHKMPLLGMEKAWMKPDPDEDAFNSDTFKDMNKWQNFAKKLGDNMIAHGADGSEVFDGQEMIKLAHGSFDNDVTVVTRSLERILGGELKTPVENLRGF